jgi:hypothetical protein
MGNKMTDTPLLLNAALQILVKVYEEGHPSEIADAMDMISAYREQYIEDNGAFGVGA